MAKKALITVENDDSCGNITINTISPEMKNGSWSGSYYTDYPVTLTAKPKSGYEFAHWLTSTGEKIKDISTEIELNSDITVTAIYKNGVLRGDINSDGTVNVADLVLLQKHLLNITPLTQQQGILADVQVDGVINISDAIILKRVILQNKD